ncbi:MAG: NUDIX hydrolase [Candidatus Aenigmarchaeota archaeon]|nr:NUDIX hydrolase [Candidatus Aenigmarchaeota archaeon]
MTIEKKIVCSCAIEKDGKFLLVQEAKEKVRGMWNLPGGKVDRMEDIVTAAKREVKEETGYDVKISGLLNITNFLLKDRNIVALVLVFKGEITGGEIIEPNKEIQKVGWFTKEEIESMDENEFRKGMKEVILNCEEDVKIQIPLEKIKLFKF